MIKINKLSAPDGLKELYDKCKEEKLSPDESYKKLGNPLKQKVIDNLMAEQGHICAYCMRRIPDERELPDDTPDVSIEHIIPRNPIKFIDVNQGLDYNNMVAVCSGNRGKKKTRKPRDLTCDAKRGRKDITINPLDSDKIALIKYREDGSIFSDDTAINDDLDISLNLNCSSDLVKLPETRKNVLTEFQSALFSMSSMDTIKNNCERYLDLYLNESDPKTPYSGIIIWWLQEYIKKLTKV